MSLPDMTDLSGDRVKRAGWDDDNLFVLMTKGEESGRVLRFQGVPEKVYRRLCKSGLPDKFLASHIDGKYPVAEA